MSPLDQILVLPESKRWIVLIREPRSDEITVILPNGDVIDTSKEQILIELRLLGADTVWAEHLIDYLWNFYALRWRVGADNWERLTLEQAHALSPGHEHKQMIG